METQLATIPPLRTALTLATEAGDIVKMQDVRAMATAMQQGAKARGMGIEAENAAAEVVLRAERAIGQALLSLKERGLFGVGLRPSQSQHRDAIARLLADGPLTSPEIATRLGLPKRVVSQSLSTSTWFRREYPYDPSAPRTRVALWFLVEEEVERANNLVELADLSLSVEQSTDWQRLASLDDETFERMLFSARESGGRLAKHNFYSAPRGPHVSASPPTRSDPAFAQFRAGAYGLLGWQVGEDGSGSATRNGLLGLPEDELRQLAGLVRALATAYNEARAARVNAGA